MMFKMTATAQRPGDEPERQFGWQDMFVGPDADPRGIGGIFVHHGDERTVLAGYLHDYRLTLELKCAGLGADAMARRSVDRPTSRCSAWCVTSRTPNGTGSAR